MGKLLGPVPTGATGVLPVPSIELDSTLYDEKLAALIGATGVEEAVEKIEAGPVLLESGATGEEGAITVGIELVAPWP